MTIPVLSPLYKKFIQVRDHNRNAAKIAKMQQERELLKIRRTQAYQDLEQLEQLESDHLSEGKKSTNMIAKRRLAAQISQLRKDISRIQITANMLNSKINILSTNIHNLSLINEGSDLGILPNAEQLTKNAVAAEQVLEELSDSIIMANSLNANQNHLIAGEDEAAILAEFDAKPEVIESKPDESSFEQVEVISAMAEKA